MKTKEEIKQYKKEWHILNREKVIIRCKKWYEENKNTRVKEYKLKNREKILQQKRESYERCKETYKKYWQTPKAKHNAKIQKYKNRAILSILEHHSDKEWLELLKKNKGKCVDCKTTENIEKDHIIPLSRGGNDLISNILPRCRRCNSKKGNRTPYLYPQKNICLTYIKC